MFSRSLLPGLVILFSSSLFADATPRQTCFGNAEQTQAHLQRIVHAIECSGSQSVYDCKSTITIDKGLSAAIVGAIGLKGLGESAGVMASLRARMLEFCKVGSVSIFSSKAYADNMRCNFNTQSFRRASQELVNDMTKKLKNDVEQAKSKLSDIRNAASTPITPAEKAAVQLESTKKQMQALLEIVEKRPGMAYQTPYEQERGAELTAGQKEVVAKRAEEIKAYIEELDGVESSTPEKIAAAIEKQTSKSAYGFFDGMKANAEINQLRTNNFGDGHPAMKVGPSAQAKFLESIKDDDLPTQQAKIKANIGKMPGLQEYADQLDKIRRLQNQQGEFFRGSRKLLTAPNLSNQEILEGLRDTVKTKVLPVADLSPETLASVRKVIMFNAGAAAEIAKDASMGLRQSGGQALARFIAFRGSALAVRGGLAALGIFAHATGWAATLLLHSTSLGSSDPFACSNKYAVFSDRKKCEIAPEIGPQTIPFFYELSLDEQMKVLNEQQQFCQKMKEVDDSQGPASWKAQCTNQGHGFTLTSKIPDQNVVLDFNTDSDGKLSKMRFLSPTASHGAHADDLGLGLGDFRDDNLAVEFDQNEKAKSVLQINSLSTDPRLLNFSEPNEYQRTAFQQNSNNPKVAANLSVYQASILSASEVQMCCTGTEGNIDDICDRWGINRAGGPNQPQGHH